MSQGPPTTRWPLRLRKDHSTTSNAPDQPAENIVRQVIERIEETTQGDFSLKRYFQQLRVLAQLRSLETQIDKIMDSIAEYINEERDVLYIRGERKGKHKFIIYLLNNTNQTAEQIAKTAEVPVDFVTMIKAELSTKEA